MNEFIENFTCPSEAEGLRIDLFLKEHYPDFSRTYFQNLLEHQRVLINDKIVKKQTLVKEGDVIQVSFPPAPEIDLSPENIPLDILYEDDTLLIVNKPVGLVVHPGAGNWKGTLVNGLLHHCQQLSASFNNPRPGIVHRLDKDTSGLLVVAKTPSAHRHLTQQFSQREVRKIYLAVCLGHLKKSMIEGAIKRDPYDRKKMSIQQEGRHAITLCHTITSQRDLSLVSLFPKTGRTHQLRVHLQSIQCPIIGDPLYGIASINDKYKQHQQLLHAYTLSFTHPTSLEKVTFKAPLPDRFKEFLVKHNLNVNENLYESCDPKS